MKENRLATRDLKALYLIAVLLCTWAVLLLPAAWFSQWFTLDLGGVFEKAADYPDNVTWALSPYNRGGRYFPVYWLYNFAVFFLFPANIAANYGVQIALFVVSLGLTSYLLYKCTDSRKATLIFGIIACLGGAVTENLYTLGKAEHLAYLLIIAALVLFYTMGARSRYRLAARFGAVAVLSALAIWCKETSLVLLAFCPAAVVAYLVINRESAGISIRALQSSRYPALLVSIIAGYLISKIPYIAYPNSGDAPASYIDYSITPDLIIDNLLFYATQQPDVLIFGVCALVFCGVAALRIRSRGYDGDKSLTSNLVFVTAILLMAWGYYLGMLIWRWPMGYYMLLPSIMFKFGAICGLVFVRKIGMVRDWMLKVLLSCLFALTAYAFAHSFYVASSQISYSRMYTEAVSKYLADSKPQNRLVIESFPFYAEQVTNTQQMISIMSSEDRGVNGIADLLNPEVATPSILKLLNISREQLANNVDAIPGKNDYLLLMTGNKLGTWAVRGVAPYFSEESILKEYGAYEMSLVAANQMVTPSLFINIWTSKIDFGPTYFGYKLYKIVDDGPRILWGGRYPDGWMGKSATVRLSPEFGSEALVTVSTPNFNSPNRLTVERDGIQVKSLELVDGKEVSFVIDINIVKTTNVRFSVERTVVPKGLKVNQDRRALGVLIRVEPH